VSYKFLLVALLLSLAAAPNSVAAENLDDAVEAMHKGDFARAYCIMHPLAKAGDAEAQYNIGWMYLNGYGLRVDDRQALQWWEQASEQGHTDASFSIGMLYSLGEGKVQKDLDRAIDFYLVAAEDGHEDAIKLLQYMMMRNDQEIRGRLHTIIKQHGSMFGTPLKVKAKKLNAREGPSVNEKVVTRLVHGQAVLELSKKGKWSQVVVLGEEQIDQTVWVYNRFLESSDLSQDSDQGSGHGSGQSLGQSSGSNPVSDPASRPVPLSNPHPDEKPSI